MVSATERPEPGRGGDPEYSVIAAELRRRAAAQSTERSEASREISPLLRVRAYILLTIGFLGFWVWSGVMSLALWLWGGSWLSGTVFIAGWVACWLVVLPATLMWHAPELLKRRLGQWPESVKGFAGYLLRNADKGVFDGSQPLVLGGASPPPHFWFVACLNSALSGSNLFTAYTREKFFGGPDLVMMVLLWAGLVASVLSVAVLTHGALTRRAARKKREREQYEKSEAAQ